MPVEFAIQVPARNLEQVELMGPKGETALEALLKFVCRDSLRYSDAIRADLIRGAERSRFG